MIHLISGPHIKNQLPLCPGFYYLATPYGKFPAGRDEAYAAALDLTGLLMLSGYVIYSPIVHCHNIAKHFTKLGTDHLYWLEYDGRMLTKADGLIVADMTGWKESVGVNAEIMTARALEKPIWFLPAALWDDMTSVVRT